MTGEHELVVVAAGGGSGLGRATAEMLKDRGYAQLVGHIIDNRILNGETIRLDGALRMAPR
jgi:NADP-dependent 3-hydroxy acid dehydrogenase YdfG